MTISDDDLLRKIRAVARTSAEQTGGDRLLPTWRRIFELARALQAVDVPADPDLLWAATSTWWELARPRQDAEDCYAELLRCYPRVHVPAGSTRLEAARKLAETEPLPVDALRYPTPRAQRLVALCYWLSSLSAPGQPWWLSCRSAAQMIGGSHMAASSLLSTLVRDGVLAKAGGGGRRATRYSYCGELRLAAEILALPEAGEPEPESGFTERPERAERPERPERPENTEDNRGLLRFQNETRARASARAGARERSPEKSKALTLAETGAAARAAAEASRKVS